MPITPDRKHLYPPPKVWKAIRAKVLKRADDHCEQCGLDNGALGFRDRDGGWTEHCGCCDEPGPGERPVKIVLTIHHRDGDPQNSDMANLLALCQQCHNRADGPMRAKHAAQTRAKKKMKGYGGGLFENPADSP